MFGTQTFSSPDSPHRLLRPSEALRRLRPVKLALVVMELQSYGYQCQALEILRKYGRLPKRVRAYGGKASPHWTDLFREFLQNCERWGWFEVDWPYLDDTYRAWMESGEGDYFANWLRFIPIERYGFSDWDEEWPEQYHSIALLKALLDGDWGEEFLVNLIDEYNLEADWHSITQYDLWERLSTHDFRHYGAPLCWLPDVAKIACNRTGNDLMDCSNYFEDDPVQYTWAEDLEQAKQVYREAKPWVEKLRAFLRWCDGPAEMQALVDALVGQDAPPKRKRKKGPKANRLNTLVNILTP